MAVGWPKTSSGANGIEAFLEAENMDTKLLRNEVKQRLPGYMVPRKIHLIKSFPLNSNGKYDRKALAEMLENDDARI